MLHIQDLTPWPFPRPLRHPRCRSHPLARPASRSTSSTPGSTRASGSSRCGPRPWSGGPLLELGGAGCRARPDGGRDASSSTTARMSRGLRGADGVHVGQDDLRPVRAPERLEPGADRRLLDAFGGAGRGRAATSRSTTSRSAPCSRARPEWRWTRRSARRASSRPSARRARRGLPVVAIGGITAENAARVHRRRAPRRWP